MLPQVSATADYETIERANRSALGQQMIHQVAADETGAACHQIDSIAPQTDHPRPATRPSPGLPLYTGSSASFQPSVGRRCR